MNQSYPVISRTGVYGLAQNDNKLLVVKQFKGPHKNKWDLPGGKIEEKETIEQALRREFMEEVSMHFNRMQLLNNFTSLSDGKKQDGSDYIFYQIGLIYQVHDLSAAPEVIPEMEFSWLTLEDLQNSAITPLLYQTMQHLGIY